jgi:SAM-dependent methyltransferase
MSATDGNAQQFQFWNGPAGERWARLHRQIDNNLRPVAELALKRLAPRPGERVIDIGCGAGATSLAIAERVEAHGHVLGLDISVPLLKIAEARAAVTPEYPIEFRAADASEAALAPASFDALFSRFGVMFFADPVAAFANLARALKPGGRLVFVCWRDRRENRWVRVAVEAARKHIAALPPPPGPEDPGPFSFADEARIRRVLGAAGFADIAVERFDADLPYGEDATAAAAYLTEMGPVAAVLNEHPAATRAAVAAEIEAALAPLGGPGGIRLGASIWIVAARRG